jgi:pilus assembly protein CpaB
MNKRALLIAIVAAVVGSLLLFLYLRRFEQDMSGGDRIRLLVTVKPIERNAVIAEDMLTEREVPVAYVEDRAVKRQEKPKVIGLRVGTALQANQTLMWTDLAIATDERRDLSSLVQPGNRAVTVRALGEDAKSGALITPGDYVDVVATMPVGNGTTAELQSIVLLQRILVLAVGLDTTADTRQPGGTDAASRGAKYARDLMLTLSINVQEAQLIALAQDKGKLSVALRNPDDQRIVDGIPDLSSTTLSDKGRRVEVTGVRNKGPSGPVNLGKQQLATTDTDFAKSDFSDSSDSD